MINPVLLLYVLLFLLSCSVSTRLHHCRIPHCNQRWPPEKFFFFFFFFFFLQGCRLNTGIVFIKPSQGSKLRPIQLPMQSNPSVAIFLAIMPDIALPNFSSSSLVLSLIFTMDLYLFFAHFPNSGLYSLLSLNM